jgi:Na+/melibiose symporter-like transporter
MKALWQVLARQRDYRLLLSAGLVSLTGDWLLRIGLVFHVYVLTGSTLASGGMLLSSFLPQIVLGSLAGVFVDRWDRRRTMIATNLLHAFGLLPLLLVRDADQLWLVYLVVLSQSCLAQFFLPAEQALVPHLVRPDQLVTANALNSQNRDIARLVGAALGGLLAGLGGLTALAIADAATFLLSAVLLSRIRYRASRPVAERVTVAETVRRVRRDWVDGTRLCRGEPTLRLVIAFGVVTGIGEGIMSTLFAPFVRDELGGDGTTYGLIVSSQAIGGIAGGLVAAAIGHRMSPARLWGIGAVLFGLIDTVMFCYPLFWDGIWPAVVCMIAVGLPGAFTIAGLMTVVQQTTVDESRGRVFGALIAVQGAATLIGIVSAGVLGELAGIIPVLVVQGLGYVAGGTVVLLRRRTVQAARPTGALAS